MQKVLVVILAGLAAGVGRGAASPGEELARTMAGVVQDGDSTSRLRITVEPEGGGEAGVIQVRAFTRRGPSKSEVVYRVLWPGARKGEALLVRQTHSQPSEAHVLPPEGSAAARAGSATPVLGSDLALVDLTENFFLWPDQRLLGEEECGRVKCLLLESRPPDSACSPYGKIRSWIDPERNVALRVEKFDGSGAVVLVVETESVIRSEGGRFLPSEMTIRRKGSGTVTRVQGTGLRRDTPHPDEGFTPAGLATKAPQKPGDAE